MTVSRFAASATRPPDNPSADPALSEEARFEALLAPLTPDLVRYFARRVVPMADAPDWAAETALVMWRRRRKLPETFGEQRAWAFGIARNILANHTRKQVRRSLIDASVRATVRFDPAEVSDQAHRASDALSTLPPSDKELIRLIIWEELTISQAGAVLGLRPPAARKRYERAVRGSGTPTRACGGTNTTRRTPLVAMAAASKAHPPVVRCRTAAPHHGYSEVSKTGSAAVRTAVLVGTPHAWPIASLSESTTAVTSAAAP